MRFLDIIEKKRDKFELSHEEIYFSIKSIVEGVVPDYQISAFLMAIYLNKLTVDETYDLTMAMVETGETEYISGISERSIDKHSTGGVGDKLTLVIAPILSALGVPIIKMSGRGLGITGGTLDKLESIPQFDVYLSKNKIEKQAREIGIVISAQTKELAPADKILYELRDVTATVDNISLIASSIMSKKLAIKNKALSIDLKVGKGAFMKNIEQARELASIMKYIAYKNGREINIVLSDMNNPIGRSVGNTLEIIEVVDVLKGDLKEDVYQMAVDFSAHAVKLIRPNENINDIKAQCIEVIDDGSALNKFEQMVSYQGGDISFIKDINKFSLAKNPIEIRACGDGFIDYDANLIGQLSLLSGAGREKKEDKIDFGAGIYFNKVWGDFVNEGDVIYNIYTNKNLSDIDDLIKSSYNLLDISTKKNRIIEVI